MTAEMNIQNSIRLALAKKRTLCFQSQCGKN